VRLILKNFELDGSGNEIWRLDAIKVIKLLKSRELGVNEVLTALEDRISAVNPIVNALPTLCFERARDRAKELEKNTNDGTSLLAGLPVPIKDSIPVEGVRTTYGSLVYKDYIPNFSDAVVKKIENNGGIVFAKSNTPEFEAGANTYNEVFGATHNPWDLSRSAGGSSGGAAVAVATGMAWAAQGTDFACSLRNPASFNNVVGLRPSIGVVPQGPNNVPFQTLSVSGPIARSVVDCGLLLDGMSGFDPIDPFSFEAEFGSYLKAAQAPKKLGLIGFSMDLGLGPVDPDVKKIMLGSIEKIIKMGVDVVDKHPDMSGSHEAFRTLRALQFATAWGGLLPDHLDLVKPDVVWNIREGYELSSDSIRAAEEKRRKIRLRLLNFFTTFEALVLPASIVPPYPLNQRYVSSCDGVEFKNYLEWMAASYAISLTGCPSISIPAGFTETGLPVGLQIVMPPKSDAKLLSFAAAVEAEFDLGLKRPIEPSGVNL